MESDCLIGTGFLLGVREKVLKRGCSDGCAIVWKYLVLLEC